MDQYNKLVIRQHARRFIHHYYLNHRDSNVVPYGEFVTTLLRDCDLDIEQIVRDGNFTNGRALLQSLGIALDLNGDLLMNQRAILQQQLPPPGQYTLVPRLMDINLQYPVQATPLDTFGHPLPYFLPEATHFIADHLNDNMVATETVQRGMRPPQQPFAAENGNLNVVHDVPQNGNATHLLEQIATLNNTNNHVTTPPVNRGLSRAPTVAGDQYQQLLDELVHLNVGHTVPQVSVDDQADASVKRGRCEGPRGGGRVASQVNSVASVASNVANTNHERWNLVLNFNGDFQLLQPGMTIHFNNGIYNIPRIPILQDEFVQTVQTQNQSIINFNRAIEEIMEAYEAAPVTANEMGEEATYRNQWIYLYEGNVEAIQPGMTVMVGARIFNLPVLPYFQEHTYQNNMIQIQSVGLFNRMIGEIREYYESIQHHQ